MQEKKRNPKQTTDWKLKPQVISELNIDYFILFFFMFDTATFYLEFIILMHIKSLTF